MAFKIYVENNHIVVQDLISNKEFRAASKEALFFKDRVSEDTYNTNGFFPEGLQGIKFSDIVDENETPFVNEQAFIDFFSTNTGNFNSPQVGGVKEAVYYVEGQDVTGFTNVIERKNTIGVPFEFVRTGVGTFSCVGFDVEVHAMSFSVRNASATEISNFFQDVNNDFITTIKTPLVNAGFEIKSDLAFANGGTIIIAETFL